MSDRPVQYTNDRGFRLYGSFEDHYGAVVNVIESSADPLDKCWVFVKGGELKDNDGSINLTPPLARTLIAALKEYLEHKGEAL